MDDIYNSLGISSSDKNFDNKSHFTNDNTKLGIAILRYWTITNTNNTSGMTVLIVLFNIILNNLYLTDVVKPIGEWSRPPAQNNNTVNSMVNGLMVLFVRQINMIISESSDNVYNAYQNIRVYNRILLVNMYRTLEDKFNLANVRFNIIMSELTLVKELIKISSQQNLNITITSEDINNNTKYAEIRQNINNKDLLSSRPDYILIWKKRIEHEHNITPAESNYIGLQTIRNVMCIDMISQLVIIITKKCATSYAQPISPQATGLPIGSSTIVVPSFATINNSNTNQIPAKIIECLKRCTEQLVELNKMNIFGIAELFDEFTDIFDKPLNAAPSRPPFGFLKKLFNIGYDITNVTTYYDIFLQLYIKIGTIFVAQQSTTPVYNVSELLDDIINLLKNYILFCSGLLKYKASYNG